MVGHLIYNHQHLDDARIQQEISKGLYSEIFGGTHTVHAFNGTAKYEKYLEDQLFIIENRGHFKGASDLINIGLDYYNKNKIEDLKYILITAADTWILDGFFIKKIIEEMKSRNKVMAASSWLKAKPHKRPNGFSCDFFILDIEWNRESGLFPLDYDSFLQRTQDIFVANQTILLLEYAIQHEFDRYFLNNHLGNDVWIQRDQAFRRIVEREPIHKRKSFYGKKVRLDNWPHLGIYTSPKPSEKKIALQQKGYDLGSHTHKLLSSRDLSYYNNLQGL